MANKKCIVAILQFKMNTHSKDASILAWRSLIGPTNCSGGLRAQYGTKPPFNAFHGSDSIQSFEREKALLSKHFSLFD